MTIANRLLASVPEEPLRSLARHFHSMEVAQHSVVNAPEQPLRWVYFVESGLVSIITRLSDGRAAEVGLVGADGMVGVPLLLGGDTSATEALAQTPCTLLRIGAEPFREALAAMPAFHTLLLRYALATYDQAAQVAACNAHHMLDQRFARWLLTAADLLGEDEMPMTQEFLAIMLCVQRPAVSVAAGVLQHAGLIRYARGHISLLDRRGLEAESCECYSAIRHRLGAVSGRHAFVSDAPAAPN